ncbi:M20 family metallopeptidase [Maribacter polysiphoniae]|uniref:Probable succinyl-diaminopimelate desuccinylase n=1 Tax=Maribacter polysiphoniae TaxID=429344 RepID=A0A316EHY2_9FLAO|nr:M20 family metallopeptidase [Maribacter polysiphoniae]MBD1261666.1 M20 family metallopeptidase [Maribacter polysiphoniae]PWK22530.1 succinyl-diaminopimelate desuccinylase [Maribacter polysiphoniae]
MIDVMNLTKRLIAMDTINPPGNEYAAAKFIGNLLEENGFDVEYVPFESNRIHVIAGKGYSENNPPIVFTGHFDTVPLGVGEWSVDPFGGEVKNGKIYGRGSTDMKGGVAAMVVAAINAFSLGSIDGGVRLVLTAGEELGCQGAKDLIKTYPRLGEACGIVVGEPTANIPAIGHKGGLYLNLSFSGVTAHSSMPHLGDNAIYKAARAISKVEKFDFGVEEDPLLGFPTVNVGKVSGGQNLNSVPDHAEFTIDARTTTKVDHDKLLAKLQKELGEEVSIETLTNLIAVSTEEKDPFVQRVYDACGIPKNAPDYPRALPYLTDGSVLQGAYGGIPTVILGPGQPEMAHQTDEFCYVDKLEKSVEIYTNILLKKKDFVQ